MPGARRRAAPALEASVKRKQHDAPNVLRIKLYGLGTALPFRSRCRFSRISACKVIAEDAYPVAFKGEDGTPLETFVLDFLMERTDRRPPSSTRSNARSKTAFHAVVAGLRKATASTSWSSARASSGATSTILRAAAKYLRQDGHRVQPGLYGAGARAQSGHRRTYGRAVPRRHARRIRRAKHAETIASASSGARRCRRAWTTTGSSGACVT